MIWPVIQRETRAEQQACRNSDKPKVTIVAPVLGRPEGVQRLLASIAELSYPKDRLEVIIIEDTPRLGVPKRLKEGVEQASGEYIVFASNDMEFTPESITRGVLKSEEGYALVAFNTGPVLPCEGNVCEHFLIRKDFIGQIGGEIFDTDFHHTGVDNLLWAKCKRLGEAVSCREAIVIHHHFSRGGQWDDIYALGWSLVEADRALLASKLAELNLE